jgi:outer membrane protease
MKRELNKLYKLGALFECYKLLNRYYSIIKDIEYSNDDETSRYYGEHRNKEYQVNKQTWRVELHNGEVVSVGYSLG